MLVNKTASGSPKVVVVVILAVLAIAGFFMYRYISKPASPYKLIHTQNSAGTKVQEYVNAQTGSKYTVKIFPGHHIAIGGGNNNVPSTEQFNDEHNILNMISPSNNK